MNMLTNTYLIDWHMFTKVMHLWESVTALSVRWGHIHTGDSVIQRNPHYQPFAAARGIILLCSAAAVTPSWCRWWTASPASSPALLCSRCWVSCHIKQECPSIKWPLEVRTHFVSWKMAYCNKKKIHRCFNDAAWRILIPMVCAWYSWTADSCWP